MDRIRRFKGMFAVKYNCDVASRLAIIDFSEGERREGMKILICCTQGYSAPIKKQISAISADYLGFMNV